MKSTVDFLSFRCLLFLCTLLIVFFLNNFDCLAFFTFIEVKFNGTRCAAFPSKTAEWAFWSFSWSTTNFQWATTTWCSWWCARRHWCWASRIESAIWIVVRVCCVLCGMDFVIVFVFIEFFVFFVRIWKGVQMNELNILFDWKVVIPNTISQNYSIDFQHEIVNFFCEIFTNGSM